MKVNSPIAGGRGVLSSFGKNPNLNVTPALNHRTVTVSPA